MSGLAGTVALTPPARILDMWAIGDLFTHDAFRDLSYDFQGLSAPRRRCEHRPDRLMQQCPPKSSKRC